MDLPPAFDGSDGQLRLPTFCLLQVHIPGCEVFVQNLSDELGGALVALVGQLSEELEIPWGQKGNQAVDVSAGRMFRHDGLGLGVTNISI
jgi:hypothetical protein